MNLSVAAIIPAYNEEQTVGRLVRALIRFSLFSEIIVVSDGSTDRTVERATKAGARVIILPKRLGKTQAIYAGARATRRSILCFIDGDVRGFSRLFFERLLDPLRRYEAGMSIGLWQNVAQETVLVTPRETLRWLSGIRAIRRDIVMRIPFRHISPFGIEVAMNDVCRRSRIPVHVLSLPSSVRHLVKERKWGVFIGFFERMRMGWHILKTYFTRVHSL